MTVVHIPGKKSGHIMLYALKYAWLVSEDQEASG